MQVVALTGVNSTSSRVSTRDEDNVNASFEKIPYEGGSYLVLAKKKRRNKTCGKFTFSFRDTKSKRF